MRDALYSLPSRFKSDLAITGVLATDLFTFNASLGASIESQVVEALNELRSIWDPEQKFAAHRFVRQPQKFPDVILRTTAPGLDPTPLLGIELKGWYVLAKEREPSFRYTVTPAVCSEFDSLVVFPWALSNVVSGSPLLFDPYVIGARYAAEYRNWHWRHKMTSTDDKTIDLSTVTRHYPDKSDPISDRPVIDRGKNFGRIARTELMDEYIGTLFRQQLSGIPVDAWQKFFKVFSEQDPVEGVDRLVTRLAVEFAAENSLPDEAADELKRLLGEIAALFRR